MLEDIILTSNKYLTSASASQILRMSSILGKNFDLRSVESCQAKSGIK